MTRETSRMDETFHLIMKRLVETGRHPTIRR